MRAKKIFKARNRSKNQKKEQMKQNLFGTQTETYHEAKSN